MCESNFTFENFVVKDTNRFAHAAALAVAENPNIVYNPLVIYGQTGVGKTHLVSAIKNYINKQFTDKKIEFVKGEDFANQFDEFSNENKLDNNVDVLIVDDFNFIIANQYAQEEFLNLFNDLYKNKKQIIVTVDHPLKNIKEMDERIKSFLDKGLIADIVPDDFYAKETLSEEDKERHKRLREKFAEFNDALNEYNSETKQQNRINIDYEIKKISKEIFKPYKEVLL